ncbi:MAG TPA: hypothetical protein VFU63_12705, partial [Ktedonobacterales bacterium]|nr:hypothetical protein [Ktedonobacterales bacterium]
MGHWQAFLLPAAVLLVIPIAVIPGYRRSTGSIIISGALTTTIFAVFWLVLGGINRLISVGSGYLGLAVFFGGVLLTIVTWALSLNAAAQARRWVWVALLFVAGYLTSLAVFVSMYTARPCSIGLDGTPTCSEPDPLRQALTIAGYLACPVAALVYGIRPPGRRVRQAPEGLVVSSLRAKP